MESNDVNSTEEQKQFDPHVKKYNWLLLLLAVVTIPFILTNM